ncbi:MAG: glycosyltransferase family 2 protein [Beijerinckiaceae bacterium]
MSDSSSSSPHLIVGIASAGRPETLGETIAELGRQTRLPDRIVVCVPDGADAANVAFGQCNLSIIKGPRGLTVQRNVIIRSTLVDAGPNDVLVFFDDDFFPAPDYLEEVMRLFETHQDVVMSTGLVMADGIKTPGYSPDYARSLIGKLTPADDIARSNLHDVYNAYGCNMAVRLDSLRRTGAIFDERLPLYGWLEDVDFSRAIAGNGRIVRSDATRGVHLGVKGGRQSGLKLGYSQIANPVYLMGKHRCARSIAFKLMARNLTANLVLALKPEPHIDRSGRLSGNMKAISDLVRGRLRPEGAALL